MDIQLPKINGYELTREIKRMKDFSDITIIAMTAYSRQENREKCLQAGMIDYIQKPININELFEMIRKIIL